MTGPPASPSSVLIVDDDAYVRQLLHEIFASSGYRCRLATNGQEALDAFVTERPPLTLTDVKMPGMDGLEFVKRAHALDPEAVMLVLTGVGDVETAVESLTGGAYDFILKPVKPQELLQAAQRALEHGQLLARRREEHETLERRVGSPLASPSCGVRVAGRNPWSLLCPAAKAVRSSALGP